MTRFHEQEIERTNRNLKYSITLLLICVVVISFFSRNYLRNVVYGPFSINGQQVADLDRMIQDGKEFVTVSSDSIFPLGYTVYEQRVDKYSRKVISEQAKYSYALIPFGSKFILSKLPYNHSSSKSIEGELVSIPSDLENRLFDQREATNRVLKPKVISLMIDASDYKKDSPVLWGVIAVILGVVMFYSVTLYRRMNDTNIHPVIRNLYKYGDALNIMQQQENEFADKENLLMSGQTIISKTWIIIRGFYGIQNLRTFDVIWIYKQRTRHYTNFIRTSTSFEILLATRSGTRYPLPLLKTFVSVKSYEKAIDDFILKLQKAIPWAIFGYSKELDGLYGSSRKQLEQIVDDRIEKISQ